MGIAGLAGCVGGPAAAQLPRPPRILSARLIETKKLFGLDEKINVAGRLTTIREQHQNRKVHTIRGNNGPVLGKDPFGHWAVIQKDEKSIEQFDISEADFKYLRGEAGCQ